MIDEDKKLILEWCRFACGQKVVHDKQSGAEFKGADWMRTYCVYPDGQRELEPDLDLNFYFRYAVPKLRQELGEDSLIKFLWDWVDEAILHRAQRNEAEAFGQALLELIREEK